MKKKYWEDLYLYQTIKGFTKDPDKLEKIFDLLHSQETWTVDNILEMI